MERSASDWRPAFARSSHAEGCDARASSAWKAATPPVVSQSETPDTGSDGAGERARGTRALGESIALIKDSGGLAEPARQRLLHSGDLVECIAQVPPREL